MAYTLDGTSLGTLNREQHTKSSELDIMAFPLSDSTSTEVWDFNGCTRKIQLEGIYAGTLTEVRTFINKFEGIVNGSQTSGITYASTMANTTYTVKIERFIWKYTVGEAGVYAIGYQFQLVESSA